MYISLRCTFVYACICVWHACIHEHKMYACVCVYCTLTFFYLEEKCVQKLKCIPTCEKHQNTCINVYIFDHKLIPTYDKNAYVIL